MKIDHGQFCRRPPSRLVRDSSAVRRLFVRLAGAVGRQSTLHKENSGFAPPTLGQHISMFRGYRIFNLVSSPIKGILEILNLTTRCIPMDILAWTDCVRSSAGKIS